MLTITHASNFLLMLLVPLVLGGVIARRLGIGWGVFLAGGGTFVASQVVHIPLNLGVSRALSAGILPHPPESTTWWLLPVALGLSAGLCEEVARYLCLRLVLKRARTWAHGLMYGAGHGGTESIILGALVAWGFVQMVLLKGADLQAFGIPTDQIPSVQGQLETYWSYPWYVPLVGALERVLTIAVHLGLAMAVLQAVVRRRLRWLWAAVLGHALLDAGAVFLSRHGMAAPEVWIAVCALASIGVLFWLRPTAVVQDEAPPITPIEVRRVPLEDVAERMEPR